MPRIAAGIDGELHPVLWLLRTSCEKVRSAAAQAGVAGDFLAMRLATFARILVDPMPIDIGIPVQPRPVVRISRA